MTVSMLTMHHASDAWGMTPTVKDSSPAAHRFGPCGQPARPRRVGAIASPAGRFDAERSACPQPLPGSRSSFSAFRERKGNICKRYRSWCRCL